MLKHRELLFLAIPLVLASLISYLLQVNLLSNQQQLTGWLSNFGPYVVLIYAILQAITIIIAPIGGFVLVVAMIALFGPATALTLSYLVCTPTYLLNFYLSRRFGRPLVIKLVGKSALEKVDHYIKDSGVFILVLTRILQGGNYDYLSYGWGLTKISFKTFLVVNILAGIPSTLMTYFVFKNSSSLLGGVVAFYLITFILSGISIYFTHHLKKHKRV